MRLAMAKKVNIEITNKVNNAVYVVTEVGDDYVKASKKVDENTLDEQDTVTVNDSNALCFRFLRDPNPETVPEGYSVKDGILYKDGSKVTEQGDLKVLEILAEVKGYLILLVKSSAGTFLNTYRPSRDRFEKSYEVKAEKLKAYKSGEDVYIVASAYEDVIDDETGEVIGQKYNGKLYAYHTIDRSWIRMDLNIPVDNIQFIDSYLVFEFVYTSDENGILRKTERTYVPVLGSVLPAELEEFFGFVLGDGIKAYYSKYMCALNLIGKDAIVVDADSCSFRTLRADFSGMEDRTCLIDISFENNSTVYSFANDKYELYKVTVKSTSDRGDIVTVE